MQIMDTRERIQGYEKDKMKAVVNGTKSAMPVFGPDRLSDSDLDDLLRYLQTLRGFDPAVQPIRRLMRAMHATRSSLGVALLASALGAAARSRSRRRRRRWSRRRRLLDGPAGRRLALADLRRQLRQPAAQPAHADHARQRQPPRAAVDVPDRHARQLRNDVAPARQRAVRHRAAERRVGDRRAHRPPDLALPPRAAAEPDRLLRPRQPRLRRARRQAVHDDARRAPARARHEDRRRRRGTRRWRTTRTATPRRSRRSSSRTR